MSYIWRVSVGCEKGKKTKVKNFLIDFGTEKNYQIYDGDGFDNLFGILGDAIPIDWYLTGVVDPYEGPLENVEPDIIAPILPASLLISSDEEDEEEEEEEGSDSEGDSEDKDM